MNPTLHPSACRPPRRRALAAGVALLAGCTMPRPSIDWSTYRMPADFEPTSALWLGFDEGHRAFTAALATALQPHVKLRMLVRDGDAAAAARATLAAAGVQVDAVDLHLDAQALFFTRDIAAFAVGPAGRRAVIDFGWNYYGLPGWCQARHAQQPERIPGCIGTATTERQHLDRTLAGILQTSMFESALVAEGGGIEVNGRGLIIANEALVRQRNPGLTLEALERLHLALPGIRKVIWLPEGLAEDPQLRATIVGNHVAWGTGGHTDEFVRFADAGTVLLAWPDDSELGHPVARLNRQRMQRNHDLLSHATDTDGRSIRVVKVPMPRIVERRIFLSAAANPAWSQEWTADFFGPHERRREGDPVIQVASASYLNFVVANGVVVLPDYLKHGTPRASQERVQRIFEGVFPGRQIRFVDALGANWVAGGPHCATLNEPAATGATT